MRHRFVLPVLAALLHLHATLLEDPRGARGHDGEEGASVPQAPAYRTETDLVYLIVAITDRRGRPITGLEASAIRVYEDGVEQKIEHFTTSQRPLTVGLVLDRSSSMSGMMGEVYGAALHVLDTLGEHDQAFALTFNSDVTLVQPLTSDLESVRRSLLGLSATGTTALYDAAFEGLEYLAHAGHGTGDRKVLCVVSDGEDNASLTSYPALLEKAKESDAVIYSVAMTETPAWSVLGWLLGRDIRRLRELAEMTGGTAHRPRSLEECESAMKRIAEELRTQYGLGYYSNNRQRDGRWRRVSVTLADKYRDYRIRTRRGYYAPLAGTP
ncbi:MAG: hypothetical protein Kow001_25080 [Acidobacteriota bacterium]